MTAATTHDGENGGYKKVPGVEQRGSTVNAAVATQHNSRCPRAHLECSVATSEYDNHWLYGWPSVDFAERLSGITLESL